MKKKYYFAGMCNCCSVIKIYLMSDVFFSLNEKENYFRVESHQDYNILASCYKCY